MTIDIPGYAARQRICTCECHTAPYAIMHIIPCCDKTYEKYSPQLQETILQLQDFLDKNLNDTDLPK